MVYSAMIYGIIFGLCLHALTSSVMMKLYVKIILQALRLYTIMMPVLTTLFFISLYVKANTLLGYETSPLLNGLSLVLVLWTLWLQYIVMIKPVVRYLRVFYSRGKSIAVTVVAFAIAIVLWQFASFPYEDRLFDKKRFVDTVVKYGRESR